MSESNGKAVANKAGRNSKGGGGSDASDEAITSGVASVGGGATSSASRPDVPSWIRMDQKLQWWSESQKKFMAVRVTKVDDKKRLVIVTFEANAQVWKSVPFSQLGRRGCPLQRGEDKEGKAREEQRKRREPPGRPLVEKEKGSASKKDAGGSKDLAAKEVASKDGLSKEHKEEKEDGTATPNWWLMEKARLSNSQELQAKEDQERRRREREEEEQRREEQKRVEILAAERRKVEEAFEMRKREAEELKLKEEEEWRSQLRQKREREAAEEEEREKEREARRKKRKEEKGRKKGKEEEAARRQAAEEAQRNAAQLPQAVATVAAVQALAAAQQPWHEVAARLAALPTNGQAWNGAAAVPQALRSAASMAPVAPGSAVATQPTVVAPHLPVVVPPRVAAASTAASSAVWGHHYAPAGSMVPPGAAALGKMACAAQSVAAAGYAPPLPAVPPPPPPPPPAAVPPHSMLQAVPMQGSLPHHSSTHSACAGGWGNSSNAWGNQGHQDARELLNVLQAHGCVVNPTAGSWSGQPTGWT